MSTPDPRIPDGDQIPQPPARRPLWRRRGARVTGAALTALIGLIVVVSATNHPSAVAATPPAPPASSAPAAPASPPRAPSTYNLPVGSTVTVTGADSGSKYTVTVNSAALYQQGQYDSAPPAGQHYVVVNVSYHAISGTADVNEMDWEAKDATGQTYGAQIVGSSNTELSATTISAGNTARGDVYLAVPNGSAGNTAVYSAGLSESASWTIAATRAVAAVPAAPAAASAPAAPAAAPATANGYAVVDQFYADINSHDYQAAWDLGGRNIGGQSYDSWVAGYATTVSISPSYTETDPVHPSRVYLNLSALQSDGSAKTYAGYYTVSGGVITGASITQQS